jgi:L-lactate dehydrogenase (cytochrome)
MSNQIATSPFDASPMSTSNDRLPSRLKQALSLDDFEELARRRLPRPIFGYIAGAAENNTSLRENRDVFNEFGLQTRILRDVSCRTQEVELFGVRYSCPFGIAPMGITALSTYRGDLVMAAAAQTAGIASIMSATSLIRLEEVAQQSPGTWFQAYLPGDQEKIDALVDRVQRAGFKTLVITVDIPVSANRENNVRTGFTTPLRPSLRLAWDGLIRPRWLAGTFLLTLLKHGVPYFENSFATRGAPILSSNVLRDFAARDHLSWSHLEAIRRRWKGALVVKGILSVEDAIEAKRLGADAVYLSNHGGRQLDGAISAMRILAAVVTAVGPHYPVLIDGGFRRGVDVLKAIALGARMVFVGRPFNFAAAAGGRDGVLRAISLLRDEIDRDLAMLGANSCAELEGMNLIRTVR